MPDEAVDIHINMMHSVKSIQQHVCMPTVHYQAPQWKRVDSGVGPGVVLFY